MHKYLILAFITLFSLSLYGQKSIVYDNPPSIKTSDYRVDAVDIVSTQDYCKLKLIVENNTNDAYFLFSTEELGFDYKGIGTYWSKKKDEIVVHPNDKKATVIEIKGDMDYRKDHFDLLVNGLKKGSSSGFLTEKKLNIKMDEESSFTHDGLNFSVAKSTYSKGKFKLQIEVTYKSDEDDMVVFDPASLIFTANGESLVVEKSSANLISFNNKPITLRPKESKTLRYTVISEDIEIECNSFEMFERFTFISIDVDPVRIGYPVGTSFIDEATSSQCEPFMGPQNGAMKVKIVSPNEICFKLDIDGFPLITSMTSNAFIFLDNGRKSYTLTTSDGVKSEGKIIIPSTLEYSQVGYVIKKDKNGYTLKYVVRDQVMTQAGLQKRQDYFDETKNKREESARTNTLTGASGTGCFGADSEGSKTITLKVSWKGNPVEGHGIEIRYGNTPIGNATTGSDGTVKIKSSAYENSLPKVDIYGCKGNTKWSVTGDWVVLNDARYFHLKLDEVAKMMSEMMGGTVDEIGKSWGL